MKKVWTSLALLAAILAAGDTRAAPLPLTSHRALYDITLARASQQSPIAQVSGRLVIEWLDTCDGYTTNQHMYTRLDKSEGQSIVSDLSLSSWESRDGQTFRFSITNRTDGRPDQVSRGRAERGAGRANGSVEFELPRAEVRDLPASTMFPNTQLVALLKAAHAGKHLVSQVVFDGNAEDGLNDVSTFIGSKVVAAAPSAVRGARALVSGAFWPVRLAFFAEGGTDDSPEFEFAYRMFDNGVSSELEFDYGEFVIKGTLKQIEALADGGCEDGARR